MVRMNLIKVWLTKMNEKYGQVFNINDLDSKTVKKVDKRLFNRVRSDFYLYILRTKYSTDKLDFNQFINMIDSLDLVKLDCYLHNFLVNNMDYGFEIYDMSGIDKVKKVLDKDGFKVFSKYVNMIGE